MKSTSFRQAHSSIRKDWQRPPQRGEKDKEYLCQVGDNIRQARKGKGLSQEEFADIAGFSRSYYNEIETGRRNISLLNLIKIMEALDADPNTVIGPVASKE
jgi:DNA-binding XRE family transcriptional regulator